MVEAKAAYDRTIDGALWLDDFRPGWAEEIDTNKLEMSSACQCVLGQLADGDDRVGYYTFLRALNPAEMGHYYGTNDAWASGLGFTLDDEDFAWVQNATVPWAELADGWQDRIAERLPE